MSVSGRRKGLGREEGRGGNEGQRGEGPLPRTRRTERSQEPEQSRTAPRPTTHPGRPDRSMNELHTWDFLGLGWVMSVTQLDLDDIHSANIYPGHQRSEGRTHPLSQAPAVEVGPSEGAEGCRPPGQGGGQVCTAGPGRLQRSPSFPRGSTGGRDRFLRHLCQVTQQQTGRRPPSSLHH